MVVYVVMIQDEFGESSSIHSIFSNELAAEQECQKLESRLSDEMVVTVEPHEVIE
jgi:hypothetical protein